jgi:putative SOS response-associated peptidase YedK
LTAPMQAGLGRTMCGRAKLEGDISEIKIAFRVPPDYPTPNFAPSWNVAPTDNLPIVRYNPKAGHRTLDLMRWGLIRSVAKNNDGRGVRAQPCFGSKAGRLGCVE